MRSGQPALLAVLLGVLMLVPGCALPFASPILLVGLAAMAIPLLLHLLAR
jgi:hypothetical protein